MPPVEFAIEASQFQYKLQEKHNITLQPVITYIYLFMWWYASSFSYFLKPNWNGGTQQENNAAKHTVI